MQITEFCQEGPAGSIGLYQAFYPPAITLPADPVRGQISVENMPTKETRAVGTEHRLHWRKCLMVSSVPTAR